MCVFLAFGVFAFWPSSNEPEYNGKTLTHWLEISASRRYDKRWPQAEEAVRHIGTNALPWLIKWAHNERPDWQTKTAQSKVWRFLPRQLYRVVCNSEFQAIWADEGFRILAPTSPRVSAELERLMDVWPERPAIHGMVALYNLGPGGLPIFLNVATNPTRPAPLRCVALKEIGNIFSRSRTNATPNLPTNTLPIVPGLLRCLEEPDPTVRAAVTNALRLIAPEVLTNRTTEVSR